MVDFLGPIMGLVGAGLQAKAQADANNLNWASLFETKRVNRKQEKLATSTREDALGNKISFDPALNEWNIDLTPETKKIIDAEQLEQLLSLTVDAPRQREAAERTDKRARQADDFYEEQFNKYRYRPEKSEEAYIGDATNMLLSSRRQGLDELSATLAQQMLRTGNSSDLPRIYKQQDEAFANSLEQAMLRGRQIGREQFRADRSADDSAMQQELGFLSGLASQGDQLPIRFGDMNNQLAGDMESALTQLLSTIGSGEGRRLNATAALANSLGKSPDLSGIGFDVPIGGGRNPAVPKAGTTSSQYIPYPRPYHEGLRARARNGF